MKTGSDLPPRKRRRPALACEECRRRKIGCDRESPCNHCTKFKRSCTYVSAAARPAVQHDHGLDLAAGSEMSTREPFPPPPSPPNSLLRGLIDRIRVLEERLDGIASGQSSAAAALSPKSRISPASIHGTFDKSRFFGQSHRMICMNQFSEFMKLFERWETDEHSDVYAIMARCKRLARVVKTQIILRGPVCSDPRDYVPPRTISDQLLAAYLRTLESAYRVIHVPSFRRAYDQYWADPAASSPAFVIKLLLILAVGSVFCPDDTPYGSLVSKLSVSQWIYTAQSWLTSPFEKARLDMQGLQLHCLLLIARQVTAIGGELAWIGAGSLLRTAMHMGFHIDPRHMAKVSPFDAEMRRRLWATILEINLQTSLDAGGIPLIHPDDYDCDPPMNLNDEEMEQDPFPAARPAGTLTQTSLQIALARSQAVRLRIAKFVNSFRSGMSYDEALELSAELVQLNHANASCDISSSSSSTNHHEDNDTHIRPFHRKLYNLMTQRFLISLHTPFALKAKSSPKYYYSRQVNFQASMRIISSIEPAPPSFSAGASSDSYRLQLIAAASFRDVPIIAHSNIFYELSLQRQELELGAILLPPSDDDNRTAPSHLSTLRPLLERHVQLSAARVSAGETNLKGSLMCACFLARLDAERRGLATEQMIYETVRGHLTKAAATLQGLVDEQVDVAGADAAAGVPAGMNFGMQLEEGLAGGMGAGGFGSPSDGGNSLHSWLLSDEYDPLLGLGMDGWLIAQGI
ncbi:Zn(II)2Cys6 transcription factor [Aspergillus saccharolyticus JOP 1030-1]|uniref:Zn(2)-C6 fungal-type domain-containing protein n=1 Tax=Aspergillus saccharolyticus JOP 1030-1 TaxID=1450539 RepID=A0A318Z8C4_9EURO|nr:hypothetical protein BP01DRAFT_358477 [Aspergillus saccharolyticus JOP 1030-1]PYH43486.1 hypothetical protein BP01DRAFT_358477 [Aspergillus saccharolyticus JOP 1030-1]